MVCNFRNTQVQFTNNPEAIQMIVHILQTQMQTTKVDQRFLNKGTIVIGGRRRIRFLKGMKNA